MAGSPRSQVNATEEGVEQYFKTAPGFVDQKSFIQACKDAIANPSLAEEQMDAVLRAEVWALVKTLPAVSAARQGTAASWWWAVSNQPLTPVPLLSLETIAECDPRECLFRNGTWTAP